jgi:predicted nucleic acid-binding protein
MKTPVRVYADTSVFGGALDREFQGLSEAFFERVRSGDVELVVSSVVLDELEGAPLAVRRFFEELSPHIQSVDVDGDVYELREAYLRARVVSPKWAADALHVAVATLSGCRAIVSWNFKHIVNFRRIPLYNAINEAEGHGSIAIHTPQEVVLDDDEEGF